MTIFDRREKSAERVREEHISIDDAVVRNFLLLSLLSF